MRPWVLLPLLLISCATSGPRLGGSVPPLSVTSVPLEFLPTSPWPQRQGLAAPMSHSSVSFWLPPELPVSSMAAAAVPTLLLPDLMPRTLKATPASRSWTAVTQAKAPALPAPTTPAAASKPTPKPTTTPAAPAPTPKPAAAPQPTAAATATLLPTDKTDGSDFRWEEVNAVAGDSVSLHFDKTNWLYLDSPAQQKLLGFQTATRDKSATTFVFKPLTPGVYSLEFQRQDLVNQSTDVRRVKLTVAVKGTRTSSTSPLAPQTSLVPANDALEASRQLAASGKTAEAVQKLLDNYRSDDTRINLELARLLNQTGQDDEALNYLDRNLTIPGVDFNGTLELGTRLAALKDAQKRLPGYVKLWSVSDAPPEDLFVLVMETLRQQKMPQIKDWTVRYASWYPAPRMKDRYLFQLGQWLEEPGDNRDVRGAWRAYNEIVQSYPLSPHWKAAGERAAYLNRNFLQVR